MLYKEVINEDDDKMEYYKKQLDKAYKIGYVLEKSSAVYQKVSDSRCILIKGNAEYLGETENLWEVATMIKTFSIGITLVNNKLEVLSTNVKVPIGILNLVGK